MQVSVESVSTLERRMTVGLPSAQIEVEVNKRLQRAARDARIDGFRRGKVPLKLVRERFGAGVRQEVLGEMINKAYFEALKQKQLQPAGMPSIDEANGGDDGVDFEFVANFEVFPDVVLGDFSKIVVTRLQGEVTEADVDQMLETLRLQQAQFEPVTRAAQKNDQIIVDYEGSKGGVPFDGGKGEGSTLILGSGQMIPGFEDGIVGMQAGETKVVELTFPADYHSEELKGQPVEFKITLHSVSAKMPVDLNEEFFKKYGVETDDIDVFRMEVRNNLTREMQKSAQNKLKTDVAAELQKLHDITVPSALRAEEIKSMRGQMMQQFGEVAGAFDAASMFPDDMFSEQAGKRVATSLIFAEIIKQQSLAVDAARVRTKVEEIAAAYNNPQELINHYFANKELLAGLENVVLEEQVIEFVVSVAQVNDQKVSYQDIVRRANAATDVAA